jgi:hypothetical protein
LNINYLTIFFLPTIFFTYFLYRTLFVLIEKKLIEKLIEKFKKALTSAYRNPQGNPLRRINTPTAMICGAIKMSKSYLDCLGSELPQDIDSESRVKNIKLWLTSKYTDYAVSFLPILESYIS